MEDKMYEVTASALKARINRKLAHEGKRLHKTRGYQLPSDYHVVDLRRNAVVLYVNDLEDYARELGCLATTERAAQAV